MIIERRHKPLTLNQGRASSPWATRREIADWRAWAAAITHRAPHIPGPVTITITHCRRDRRSLPDVGAPMPAVKGSIDGLVDSGVLTADSPDVVAELRFVRPEITGWHGLRITITPHTPQDAK